MSHNLSSLLPLALGLSLATASAFAGSPASGGNNASGSVGGPAAAAKRQASPVARHDAEMIKNLDIFSDALKQYDLFYVDSVNTQKAVRAGIDAMLSEADPYTVYYPESETKDVEYMMQGAYAGVGAVIGQLKQRGGFVQEVYMGQPAQLAGLEPGDVFVSVDDVSVRGSSSDSVSKMLRGKPGTVARVVVQRGDKQVKVSITRKRIVLDPVSYSGMVDGSVGYICLNNFTDQTFHSFSKAFRSLKASGMQSLVIDLRNNPGGLITEAVSVLNMFVPRGTKLVYTKGKRKDIETQYTATEAPVDTLIPLVVLMNEGSASASEIVAGTLQDLDRAVIVGKRSYGKGLVQTTRPVAYGGIVKVTIAKYYIPSGRCLQAIDYAKRDEDGAAERIPDSLTHEFSTKAGRTVRDGCGVLPDVSLKSHRYNAFAYELFSQQVILDYVSLFRTRHKSVAPPSKFAFSDQDYEDFKNFLRSRNFSYKSKTSESLDYVRKAADMEGLLKISSAQFDSLEAVLKPNIERDLVSFKDDVMHSIATSIMQRYYFQPGFIEFSIRDDNWVRRAADILRDRSLYNDYLSRKVVGSDNEADGDDNKEGKSASLNKEVGK